MDPRQSNVGEDSQGQFPGANIGAYQPGWNPYMYAYQGPPGWFPQGFQPRPPYVAIMIPSGYALEGFRQAEIPEACVHHSEEAVVEVPTPTSKKRNKNAVTRTKLGNFTPDEDKNLVKSWLEISCDPITCNGQKRDRMWERIIQRYNSRRASNPERSLRSLQSRWDKIRAEVTLFASYHADSTQENASGMSDADKTTHAVGNFAAVLQRKFDFLHCWELMKDAPKWQDPNARDIVAAARGEGIGEASTAEGQSRPVRSGAEASRPMGRDSAKVAKKKANSFPGANIGAYQPGWNSHMYGYQGPPGWLPQGFQPRPPYIARQAEIPEACVHHSEEDVVELPTPTSKKRNKNAVTRTKLGNFTPDEDKNLVKSWLEISCDPITSTGQKGDRMWERIIQRYNSRRASNPERSLRSLQSRWDKIRAEVTLFASYYADSTRENASGMSDDDKTTHAVGNFAAVLQRKFGFLHCWELMKDAPKWQDPNARDIVAAARGEGFGEASTAEGQSSPVRSEAEASRPMGRDSAKVAEKKANSFPGANIGAYQPGWNSHMYGYQGPPGWLPQGFQPRPPYIARQAEIPEACVHHSEEDVVELPTPTSKKRNKNAVTRTKLGNFTPNEDKNLVKSWLEISCDPITSSGQKGDRMWERIIQRYNSRRASNPERSLRSLHSRWDKIKAEVTLFASYYADSIQENASGMSGADKTTHAAGNFAAVLQRKFGFLHCWELMKDVPKWQDPNARDIAAAARGEEFLEASTAEGQSSPVRSGAEASRPMGRDSAKAAKKKANSDAVSTSSAEHAGRMQDFSLKKISVMQEEAVRKNDRFQQLASIDEKLFEEMRRHNEGLLQIELEKIRLMREKQEDERMKEEKKEDERILAVDLNACAPPLRLYYQTLQEEILEKIAARRRRSQAS